MKDFKAILRPLVNELPTLCRTINNLVNREDVINRGGCGIFAEHCVAFLEANGVPAKAIAFDNSEIAHEAIVNGTIPPHGVNHVMVAVDGIEDVYLDSEGWHPYKHALRDGDPAPVNLQALSTWNMSPECGWNPAFPRKRGTEAIKKFFANLKPLIHEQQANQGKKDS